MYRLQEEIAAWATKNFGTQRDYNQPFKGAVEELGELAHALLKQEQRIRGTYEEHEEAAKDAMGDLVIYLFDLAHLRGWNLAEIVNMTWAEVKKRDWNTNPQDGFVEEQYAAIFSESPPRPSGEEDSGRSIGSESA